MTEAANRIKADNKSIRSIFFGYGAAAFFRGNQEKEKNNQGVEEAAKQVGDEKIKARSKGRDALPPIKTSAGGNTQFILLKEI
jgi:hypothetical protein